MALIQILTSPLLSNLYSFDPLTKFLKDPLGNGLAVIVLIGMIISMGYVIKEFLVEEIKPKIKVWRQTIPVLCIIGLGIAGYLSYVETQRVVAICGPVGDCNTVQQSQYARLFGLIPIGVLGFLGYIGIFIAWLANLLTKGKIASIAGLGLFGMAIFGTIFSIYLTFLEPFVIGATCMWCLSNAILITVIMILSIFPGRLGQDDLVG